MTTQQSKYESPFVQGLEAFVNQVLDGLKSEGGILGAMAVSGTGIVSGYLQQLDDEPDKQRGVKELMQTAVQQIADLPIPGEDVDAKQVEAAAG